MLDIKCDARKWFWTRCGGGHRKQWPHHMLGCWFSPWILIESNENIWSLISQAVRNRFASLEALSTASFVAHLFDWRIRFCCKWFYGQISSLSIWSIWAEDGFLFVEHASPSPGDKYIMRTTNTKIESARVRAKSVTHILELMIRIRSERAHHQIKWQSQHFDIFAVFTVTLEKNRIRIMQLIRYSGDQYER